MKASYFLVVGFMLLFLSVIGFSDNLITDVGQKSNSDPKYVIHGLFCFAWFIILIIQANFIRKRNYKTHMRLGIAGLITALGVFTSTLYIFVVVYDGWDHMAPLVKANRFFMFSFAMMVALAYAKRKKPESHKRLMLVASIYMLGPILDRAIGRSFLDAMITTDLGWDLAFFGIWTSFFVSLFAHDLVVQKRIHPVSYLGFFLFGAIWAISFLT
jgi:hypothetical protein